MGKMGKRLRRRLPSFKKGMKGLAPNDFSLAVGPFDGKRIVPQSTAMAPRLPRRCANDPAAAQHNPILRHWLVAASGTAELSAILFSKREAWARYIARHW